MTSRALKIPHDLDRASTCCGHAIEFEVIFTPRTFDTNLGRHSQSRDRRLLMDRVVVTPPTANVRYVTYGAALRVGVVGLPWVGSADFHRAWLLFPPRLVLDDLLGREGARAHRLLIVLAAGNLIPLRRRL